jgi:TetR/AcrR family transcriptional regulator, lmrAB and yxaGH operons repressor
MKEHIVRMDTKSRIIGIATKPFQQKGYIEVEINEILKACNMTRGALYHHFPNGKEELLIASLKSINEAINKDTKGIFNQYPTTQEATQAMLEKLVEDGFTKERANAIALVMTASIEGRMMLCLT